jgi:heat-inducible transcriptional repressor
MADLEEQGFLAQPHTSAGRIPTDRGYRRYVDMILPGRTLPRGDQALIDESLGGSAAGMSEAMESIPRLLSRLTSQVGWFVAPPIQTTVLKHIEFVRIHERRVLAVFVDRAGTLTHKVLETDRDYPQAELDRAGRYLVEQFAGRTLQEIRAGLVALMAEEKARFDTLLKNAVALGAGFVNSRVPEKRLVLEGTSNLMKPPEFADVGAMRGLFETFEEKHRLVALLDRYVDQPGVQVFIGTENGDPALEHLTLVVSKYSLDDRVGGTLGVLGPTRMEYERVVALVGYISRQFSDLLHRHDD